MKSPEISSPRVQPLFLLTPAFLAMAWLVARAHWFWDHNPDLQFGYIVVLLCAYLFYESWAKHPRVEWKLRGWPLPLALAGLAGLFLVQIYRAALGSSEVDAGVLALSVMLIVAANLGFVFGWAGVKAFGMSFGFILIALPMPSTIQGIVVGGLQNLVAVVDTNLLNLMGIPATQVGSLIHLSEGTVGIDEACSGIRSLQSTIMATVFIGYLSLRRFTFQALLLVGGVALAFLGNLIRSLYLCLTAHAHGMAAVKEVHDAAGWSILAFTAAGVILISWLFNRLDQQLLTPAKQDDSRAGGTPPSSDDEP